MADPTSPRAPGRPDDTLDDAGAGPGFEELIAEVSARFITLPPGEVEAESGEARGVTPGPRAKGPRDLQKRPD